MSKKPRQRRFEEKNETGFEKKKKFRNSVIVTPQTEGQREYIQQIHANDVIFCMGPAGSGKTAVAVGMALQSMLAAEPAYEKLVVIRPAKEACDEKIGFLPGSQDEKMAPWAAPVIDNMKVFIDSAAIKNLFFEQKVEIIPLGFLRGRSLNNSFIIVDEAQNCSPKQLFMILTRLGKGSKMILSGDLVQSDIRGESGLAQAYRLYKDIPGMSFVEMDEMDIVRHPLVIEVVKCHAKALADGTIKE